MSTLRTVEEIKREAEVLFDGIELANSWWAQTLTQDRTHIAQTLCTALEDLKIPVTEEDRMESAFGVIADDRHNHTLDVAITLIKTTLSTTKTEV